MYLEKYHIGKKNEHKIVFYVITIVYMICAIYSNGFYHPDEHYQIIEFAGLKAGWNTGSDLAWEYYYQIRPTLQPWLAYILFKAWNLCSVRNPFVLVMLLRMVSAAFSIVAISFFVRCFKSTIKEEYYWAFVFVSFCLWFLPAINVRFSSETWSGLCLLVAVGLIQRSKTNASGLSLLGIGVALGLGFEFRFQTGLAVAGLILWLILVRKSSLRDLSWIGLGGMAVILIGIGMDSLFYGQLALTPYNYFKVNIIENVASTFGTAPWYSYIISIVSAPTPLIGFILLSSILLLLICDYRNIILWTVLPFIFFHSLIPHKELRFLFPMANFIPIILISAYQLIEKEIKGGEVPKVFLYSVLSALFIVNLGGLVMEMFKPAGDGRINLAHYINEKHKDKKCVQISCLENNNPYVVAKGKGLKANFYFPDNLVLNNFIGTSISNLNIESKSDSIVVVPRGYYKARLELEKRHYKLEKSGISEWIIKMNEFYPVFNENAVLLLYTKNNG